jgi:hypothetical protein
MSFQMIADTVGVTKAAIYHQFKTKGRHRPGSGRGRARSH